jgi:transporter
VTKFGWGFDKYKEEANTGKELKVYPWMKWYFLIVLPLMIISIFIIELIA